MKKTLQSIWAVIAGFLVGGILSHIVDYILESVGILPSGHIYVSWMLIVLVLLYRSIFTVIGGYVMAWLAPSSPLKHAVIGGIIGTVLTFISAIVTADMQLGPLWYPIVLAILILPSSWLGGKIFENKKRP